MTVLNRRRKQTNVVGIAELIVSSNTDETIVTYALGSCLGITVYDPVTKVAGMLHAMLPSAKIDLAKAASNPERFIDTGLPTLFKRYYALGGVKERAIVTVAGGASMGAPDREDGFQIGKRNFVQLKKMLWRNGVILKDQDVGGNVSRTLIIEIETGLVRVKSEGREYILNRRFPRGNHS